MMRSKATGGQRDTRAVVAVLVISTAVFSLALWSASEALEPHLSAVGIHLGLLGASLSAAVWVIVHTRTRSARRRAIEETQLNAGRRLERLLNDSPDIFLVIGAGARVTYRSASARRLLAPEAASQDDLLGLVAADDREALARHLDLTHVGGSSHSFELRDRFGALAWFEIRVSDLSADSLVNGHLITARDISNEVHLRHDLYRQANTDVLTGLPNRRALDRVLDEASARMALDGGAVGLISLDLDGFKDVNDTLGHQAGDELLARVAARLRQVTRADDVLLRLGGDEFAVVLPNLTDGPQAEWVAERYLRVLDEPVRLGARLEQLRTSIGVATTTDPEHVRSLVSEADMAMYAAKRAGGSRIAHFDEAMEGATIASSRISRALRTAAYDAELSLVYQPIFTVDGSRMVGLEALLRWDSPGLGSVPPDEFIPVAERSGDICAIGDWVLDSVCRQIQAWERQGLEPGLTVSINVSPHQLARDDFVAKVLATAEAFSVPTSRLVVEVTESAVLDHTGIAVQRLQELRAAGVLISIDDFGSGYSNLGQLLRVPFDVIKIDRSLLITLSEMREESGGNDGAPCAIMEAIVSIASTLQAPVVCEGVETDQQRRSLEASGVTLVQGYLTGRPVRPEDLPLKLLSTLPVR